VRAYLNSYLYLIFIILFHIFTKARQIVDGTGRGHNTTSMPNQGFTKRRSGLIYIQA
jgi:hypothetical protein